MNRTVKCWVSLKNKEIRKTPVKMVAYTTSLTTAELIQKM